MAVTGGRREERLVGAIQDVHARKEGERVREEIVAIVSHELRTPLTSVYGAIRLLARDASALSPETSRLVTLAERNAQRLLTLINDLLDLKRIEEGRLTLQPERVDLSRFVRTVIESHAELATKQDLSLAIGKAEPDALAFIDPSRMEQVVVNLISNAIKFAEPRSEVVVSVERRGGGYRLSVANRGEALSPDARDRVFAKFGQMDSSTRRRRAGTGLGLAIAKAIVDAHRGTIGYSSDGDWTTFFVDLPER
jgi:signal transduction histidine kinase